MNARGVVHDGVRIQDLPDILIGQGIEPENRDAMFGGYHSQTLEVVGAKPIGLTAGNAKPGAVQIIEVFPNPVESIAFVANTDAYLVQSIYKDCLASPLGMAVYVECYEIASGYQHPVIIVDFGFDLKRGALT